MIALKKKKEISIKINLKKHPKTTNLKILKTFDKTMLLTLPKDWEAECEIKEIFKNGVYRNGSNISMDTSDNFTESEYLKLTEI